MAYNGKYQLSPVTLGDGENTQLLTDSVGRVIASVVGGIASGSTDSGNPVKIGAVVAGTPGVVGADGTRQDLRTDGRGYLWATIGTGGSTAIVSGAMVDATSNSICRVYNEARNMVFNGSTWDRAKKPVSTARLLSAAASTNGTNIKASAGDLFRIRGYNAKAGAVYLKLYNKATAPTVGTDTPVATYYLPASAAFEIAFDNPLYFATGIGYGLTGAAADADTTALTAGDVVCMNVHYA